MGVAGRFFCVPVHQPHHIAETLRSSTHSSMCSSFSSAPRPRPLPRHTQTFCFLFPFHSEITQNASCDLIDSKSAGATLRSPVTSRCTTSALNDVTPAHRLRLAPRRPPWHPLAMRRARPHGHRCDSSNHRLLPHPLDTLPTYLCALLIGPVFGDYCSLPARVHHARCVQLPSLCAPPSLPPLPASFGISDKYALCIRGVLVFAQNARCRYGLLFARMAKAF
ncbi:hypothetical protein C8R47DRAFT_1320674 [Mycena vitilis]|nr:hypothetical protein C8R47DRAFT_1320674 [Mycena vitilis]